MRRKVQSYHRERELPQCVYRSGKAFRVCLRFHGKDYYLGTFRRLDQAAKVAKVAHTIAHGSDSEHYGEINYEIRSASV